MHHASFKSIVIKWFLIIHYEKLTILIDQICYLMTYSIYLCKLAICINWKMSEN